MLKNIMEIYIEIRLQRANSRCCTVSNNLLIMIIKFTNDSSKNIILYVISTICAVIVFINDISIVKIRKRNIIN